MLPHRICILIGSHTYRKRVRCHFRSKHAPPPTREMDISFRDTVAAVIEHCNKLGGLSSHMLTHMLNTYYAKKSLDEQMRIAEKVGEIGGTLSAVSKKMGSFFKLRGGSREQSLSSFDGQVEEDKSEFDWEGAASAPETLKTLWEWLMEEEVSIINLQGAEGVGKTWVLRRLMDRAVADNLFDIVLWVCHRGREVKDLERQIVDQLHCYIKDEHREKEDAQKILLTLSEKKYLLIVDDHLTSFDPFITVPHPCDQQKSSKVILVSAYFMGRRTHVQSRFLNLESFPEEEAWKLLKEATGFGFYSQEALELAQPLLKACSGIPRQILRLAGVLKPSITLEGQDESVYDVQRERSLVANLRKAHELAINRLLTGIQFSCEMLPSKTLRDCLSFIGMHRYPFISAHAVIPVWIMSGCLDGFASLEEAYVKGLEILQDLLDRHLLFKYDDFRISSSTEDWYWEYHYLASGWADIDLYKKKLGRLLCHWKDDKKVNIVIENFEAMYHAKEPGEPSYGPSEVLNMHGIQGCSIPCKIPNLIFHEELESLVLLESGMKSLPTSISRLQCLKSLVLRNCRLLQNVNRVRLPKTLHHLTLSGASCLRVIPDEFLEASTELEHLDLSNNHQLRQISLSLPLKMKYVNLSGCPNLKVFPSFDSLEFLKLLDLSETKVEHIRLPLLGYKKMVLALRNCCNLEMVQYLGETDKLCHLDLSGSVNFSKFEDESFPSSLLHLDLSSTRIVKLPKFKLSEFGDKPRLIKLILRDCRYLEELPFLEFSELVVLDLSGSTNFKEFQNGSLDKLHNLETLNLSATQVMKLPNLSSCTKLRNLILRSCRKVKTFPPMEALSRLQVIDLTGAISFTKFQEHFFENKPEIHTIYLSGTQVEQLPLLSACTSLRQLIMKDCQNLKVLPPLNDLRKLEVLDLSGTMFAELPVSGCVKIQQLILKKCSKLVDLLFLTTLPELEILNLSGATVFNQLPDSSFRQMPYLQELNLSGTQVSEISSLSECQNLRRLVLADCSKLAKIPPLNELTRLEILDLSGTELVEFSVSGCVKLRKLMLRRCLMLATLPSLHELTRLEALDLSGTNLVEFSVSGCIKLRKLVLRRCPMLATLPSLDELTRLEVLNLSETQVTEIPSLFRCQNLRNLILEDFSQLVALPSLDGHTRLEVLDLSGTKIVESPFNSTCKSLLQLSLRGCSDLGLWSFVGTSSLHKLDLSATPIIEMPDIFSELGNLRQLLLRDCSSLRKLPDRSLLRNLELLDISLSNVQEYSNGLSEWTHQRFLKLPNSDYSWEFDSGRCFQKFHFCLFSHTEKLEHVDICLCRQDFVFKDIYYPSCNIPQLTEEPDKFFKICGFQTSPKGIEQILVQVELLYLKKNDFITRLSDLGSGNIKVMRECWIEWCNSMESVIYGEESEENMALGRYLQNLWISNLRGLNSVFTGKVQSESFSCLKHMYVDCCPQLVVFFSSLLTLENLETLDIRFCDNLENLFGEVVLGEQTLPNLKKLILWKLPKLQQICGGVLPSLRNITVKGCLKLQSIPFNGNISRNVKVKGEEIWWNNLKWEERTKSHLHFVPI